MFVRFLFVIDILFNLFRIALWTSLGKELSPWLITCCLYFSAVLIVGVPFPFGANRTFYVFFVLRIISGPRVKFVR